MMVACEALIDRRYRRAVILERHEGRVLWLLREMIKAGEALRTFTSQFKDEFEPEVTYAEMIQCPSAFTKNELKRAWQRERALRDHAHEHRFGEDNFGSVRRLPNPPHCMPRMRNALRRRLRRTK